MDDNPSPPVYDADAQLAALRARFPAWHVWYVRNATARTVTWHATPARYPLNAGSADDLAAAIGADEGQNAEAAWCGDPDPHAPHEHHGGQRWCDGPPPSHG